MDWLTTFPHLNDDALRALKKAIDGGFRDFTRAYGETIETMFEPVRWFLIYSERFMTNTPWPLILLLVAVLVWIASRSWKITLGSIVTVSPEEAIAVGKPTLRRWLYNSARCGRCDGPVRSWQIQSRTCYACARCQPLDGAAAAPVDAAAPALFNSHCASESLEERLAQPQKLRVAELRAHKRAQFTAEGRGAWKMAWAFP